MAFNPGNYGTQGVNDAGGFLSVAKDPSLKSAWGGVKRADKLGVISGLGSLLGFGGNYTVNAPTVNTLAGTRAINLQALMASQRAKSGAYSLAAGARGSSIPLAMREAQRRGTMAQTEIGQISMMNQAQLEQAAAAQNAQMNLQAGMANQQAKIQGRAGLVGMIGTGIGAAAIASDERLKEDIELLDAETDRDVERLRGRPPVSMFEGARPPTARFNDYTDLDAGGAPPLVIHSTPRPAPARSMLPREIAAPAPLRAGKPQPPTARFNDYMDLDADGSPPIVIGGQLPTVARVTRMSGSGAVGPSPARSMMLAPYDETQGAPPPGPTAKEARMGRAAELQRYQGVANSFIGGVSQQPFQSMLADNDARIAAAVADQQRVSDANSKKALVDLQKENASLRSMLDSARSVAADVMDPAPGPVVHRMQPGATRGAQPAVAIAAGRAKGGYDVTEQSGSTTTRTQSRPVSLEEQAALDAGAQPPVVHMVPIAEASKAGKKKKMPSAVAMMPGARVSGMQAKTGIDYYPSDERAKASVQRAELGFEKVRPVSFEYKEPYSDIYGDDRQYGVLAQDLEKAPATRSLVKQGPDGVRMVDENRATMLLLAHAADNEKRLRALETQRKRKAG